MSAQQKDLFGFGSDTRSITKEAIARSLVDGLPEPVFEEIADEVIGEFGLTVRDYLTMFYENGELVKKDGVYTYPWW